MSWTCAALAPKWCRSAASLCHLHLAQPLPESQGMRQKKHKKVQRTLTFLKISHHFREPYKVRRICGGGMAVVGATAAAEPFSHDPNT